MSIINRIREKFNTACRAPINRKNAERLQNRDFSVIASNCNGGVMLHDLGQPFNSPFVNLWIPPEDYLRLLQDPRRYLSLPVSFVREEGIDYPVGLLGDVRLYFQHYASEEEAERKWTERVGRMRWDNLFVMFTDRDGCTEDQLRRFDALPYAHKIAFTHREHPELASVCRIRGFENDGSVGVCSEYRPGAPGRRYFDDFDYVSWLNSGRPK